MTGPLVEIFTDGGSTGLGHLRRSNTLGAYLRTVGYRVRVTARSAEGRRLLGEAPADPGTAAAWVIDLPAPDPELIGAAHNQPTLALDYFWGGTPTLTVSILERSETAAPGGNRLAGLLYAIIRQDIRELAPAPGGEGVVVAIGGGDQKSVGADTALRLSEAGEKVTLIQGPLAAVRDLASSAIVCLRDPPDLAKRMAQCRWAVCNGGSTLMEFMSLGKPAWVLPQTPAEERLARHVLAQGGLLGIGSDEMRAPLEEHGARIGRKACELVDGRGVERLGDLIAQMLARPRTRS